MTRNTSAVERAWTGSPSTHSRPEERQQTVLRPVASGFGVIGDGAFGQITLLAQILRVLLYTAFSVACPGVPPGAGGAFVGAMPHAVDDASAEAGMGLEMAPQLALDGRSLEIGSAPANGRRGEPAPFLDPVEQRLAGSDGRENEGHAARDRCLDVLDGAGPFHLAERGVNRQKVLPGDDPGERDMR